MTTVLKKTLKRVSAASIHEAGRTRAIVLEIGPREIGFKLAGTRKVFTLGIEGLYHLAVRRAVEAEAREKAKLKRARRRGGRER